MRNYKFTPSNCLLHLKPISYETTFHATVIIFKFQIGLVILNYFWRTVWQLSPIWPRLLVIGNQSTAEAALIKAQLRVEQGVSRGAGLRSAVCVGNKYVHEQNLGLVVHGWSLELLGQTHGWWPETRHTGAQRGAPWNKAPGLARGSIRQLGADAGPDGGDAAGTGGGEPWAPGPVGAAVPRPEPQSPHVLCPVSQSPLLCPSSHGGGGGGRGE